MKIIDIPSPKQQRIPQFENGFKAVFFVSTLLLSFYIAELVVRQQILDGMPALKWGVIFGLGTVNAVLILGMGVLAHDAVHKVLFRNLLLNELLGGLLSAFTFVPFYANRQFHLTHHQYAHQSTLDPEHTMHGRSFLYAFFVGPHVGLLLQQIIYLRNLFTRLFDKRYFWRGIGDSFFLTMAALFYFVFVPWLGISLLYSMLPTLLMFSIVFSCRALADHFALPAVKTRATLRKEVLDDGETDWDKVVAERQQQVTGWVVLTNPVLEWLWSHVNYHEVHHKYPYLSHCHLKEVFELTKGTRPYFVVKGYWRHLLNVRNKKYYTSAEQLAESGHHIEIINIKF